MSSRDNPESKRHKDDHSDSDSVLVKDESFFSWHEEVWFHSRLRKSVISGSVQSTAPMNLRRITPLRSIT